MAEESKEKVAAAAAAAPASVPTAEQILADPNAVTAVQSRRAKGARQVLSGVVHVDSTFNNTRVVITDPQGNVLSWSTGGKPDWTRASLSRRTAGWIQYIFSIQTKTAVFTVSESTA